MSADAADADAAAERRLNHSIPRTYFVRGIQLAKNNEKVGTISSFSRDHHTIFKQQSQTMKLRMTNLGIEYKSETKIVLPVVIDCFRLLWRAERRCVFGQKIA